MKQPNVIFLMTDQQRWDCMGSVNSLVRTPALDSLAAQGLLFDQAVCQCPMCVPSRNAMMFGLYPSQLGVRSNAGGIWQEDKLPVKPLPQIFRDAGYMTAGFGKTHWNHARGNPEPSARGFLVRAEGQPRKSGLYETGAVMMDDEDPEGLAAYFDEVRDYGSGEENYLGYLGCTSKVPKEHHRDGFIFRKCMEFLDGGLDTQQPLFLYLSFIKPHAGFNVPPEFEALYSLADIPDLPGPPWLSEPEGTHVYEMAKQSEALRKRHEALRAEWRKLTGEQRRLSTLRYWANCSFLDSLIGQVLEKARAKGLLDDALIVFTSDHGDMMGERDHRFSKYCLFDSSVRVPLILAGRRLPEALRGTRDHRPAEHIDLIPTLCRAAGIPCDPRLPGFDLLNAPVREGSFCEFHGGGPEKTQPSPMWMWRTPEWKLILFHEGSLLSPGRRRGELYDLRRDPQEWHNLFDDPDYREVRLLMCEALLSHIADAYAKGPAFWDAAGYGKLES